MQRALILDFDGTMVDTEWPAFEAWQAIYGRYGATLTLAEWVVCVGSGFGFDPFAHLQQQVRDQQLDREAIIAERLADKIRRIGDGPLMDGVADRIAEARALGWRLAVASSSPADWVHGHLRRLGLFDQVDAIVTRDDVTRTKPDPEIFRKAAAAIGAPPAGCVVCEDSVNGVRAAKAAGMLAVAVPNRVTAGLDFSEADLRIDSLADLRLATLAV